MKLILLIFIIITCSFAFKEAGSIEEIQSGLKNETCYICHIPRIKPDKVEVENFFTDNYLTITSKTCLNCHDGIIGPEIIPANLAKSRMLYDKKGNHHPISIEYNSDRAYLRNSNNKPGGGDWKLDSGKDDIEGLLKDGKIECSSCHNPHYKKSKKFLRLKMDRSALCFGCHDL